MGASVCQLAKGTTALAVAPKPERPKPLRVMLRRSTRPSSVCWCCESSWWLLCADGSSRRRLTITLPYRAPNFLWRLIAPSVSRYGVLAQPSLPSHTDRPTFLFWALIHYRLSPAFDLSPPQADCLHLTSWVLASVCFASCGWPSWPHRTVSPHLSVLLRIRCGSFCNDGVGGWSAISAILLRALSRGQDYRVENRGCFHCAIPCASSGQGREGWLSAACSACRPESFRARPD